MHGTTDVHAATSRSSEVGPYKHASCEHDSPYFKLSAVRPFCESVGVSLNVPTWTCIFDALDEGPHAAAAPESAAHVHHDKIVSLRRTSAQACGRKKWLRCPFRSWTPSTCACAFRMDRCAKTAPIWRGKLHSGGARPNESVCRLAARRTRHHETW